MNKPSQHLHAKNVSQLLLERGITPTQQRLDIANFLFSKQQHVSADQVLSTVKQGDNPVSKATVYNTLGLFADKGLLREVIIDPNKVFYDTNTDHHHHFYNTSTSCLTDIDDSEIAISNIPTLPEGTNVQSVDVIIKVSNN
ncbi:MAG: transcriptional repressor [Piscirickettsiaceae bacterium]|nr:MAG: transcriptional repressor [Piscirickettsiaceae bacterium]